jgi:hypothetical protein
MNEQTNKRGGARQGAGRKANDRNYTLHVRISQEAADILNAQKNKSEYIDNLIRNDGKEKEQ